MSLAPWLGRLGAKGGALTGKKAIGIILLIVGVMLMFFIISQGTTLLKSSKQYSDERGLASVQCVGYLYSISGITASADELQFDFRNELSSTEDVHNLTVAGSGGSMWFGEVSIPSSQSMAVRVPVRVEAGDNFSVYPDNCNIYPARCSLGGECAYH